MYAIIVFVVGFVLITVMANAVVNSKGSSQNAKEYKARKKIVGLTALVFAILFVIVFVSGSSDASETALKALIFIGLCAFALSSNVMFYVFYYNSSVKAFRKLKADDNTMFIGTFAWKSYTVFVIMFGIIALFTIAISSLGEWVILLGVMGTSFGLNSLVNIIIALAVMGFFSYFFILNGSNTAYYKTFSMVIVTHNPVANFIINYLGSLMIITFAGNSADMIGYNVASSVIIAGATMAWFAWIDTTPRMMQSQIANYILIKKLAEYYPLLIRVKTTRDNLVERLNVGSQQDFTTPYMETFIERHDSGNANEELDHFRETGEVPTTFEFYHAIADFSAEIAHEMFPELIVAIEVTTPAYNDINHNAPGVDIHDVGTVRLQPGTNTAISSHDRIILKRKEDE